MKNRMKTWETAALLALCLGLLCSAWAGGRQRSIASNLLRLHVIAADDSPEEQALKLRVRDAVLDYLRPRLEGARNEEEAEEILLRELEGVREAAVRAGEGRTVSLSLGTERYPARSYGGVTLPAGAYRSLRVILGEGEGRNWWCVLFPTLCLDAVESEPFQQAMGTEDFAIVSGQEGYALRFWVVELWGKLRNALG